MNRELKFKGWSKSNKQMVDLHAITPLALSPLADLKGIFIPFEDCIDILQFTGLKDKNDKEIYEGDILRIPDDEMEGCIRSPFCHVWYSDLSAQWLASYNHMHSEVADELWKIGMISEVVGNIFENPDKFPPLDD